MTLKIYRSKTNVELDIKETLKASLFHPASQQQAPKPSKSHSDE